MVCIVRARRQWPKSCSGRLRPAAISARLLASGPRPEAPLNRPDGDLRPGLESELAEDVGHVPDGCRLGNNQVFGDLTIGAALSDQRHDLLLTLRKRACATLGK